ncbi:Conserved_hypothetical protein [Hexamita inflata]|uniref:Uncharacterized protein n=1 Tax=Hexamita inflata TaxID=28002 RepID=A0AA86UCJ3_9EUKA|nr:Conserved hypothetical protein [Hexamita inflata]
MQPDDEYDQRMTDKFLGQITDGALTIENDPDLASLQFIRNLNPSKLKLIFCKNIIPTLSCSTIKELNITYCNVQSLEHYQLENLEVLKLQCYIMDWVECTQILWNIVQYPKLQQLSLFGFVGVEVAPLSQIALQITKLSLNYCELQNVDHLKILANLKELNIAYNKYVNITALKDMSQLLALDLSFCSLESIETLRSLVNLKELKLRCNQVDIMPLQYLSELVRIDLNSCGLCYISVLQYLPNLEEVDIANNSIIYIQPLQELYSIVELDARFNKIVDFHTIQYHPNHNNYHLDFQTKPTNDEMYFIQSQQQQEIIYCNNMTILYEQYITRHYRARNQFLPVQKIKSPSSSIVISQLQIQNDSQLTCLDFLQGFSIRKLELENCENIIPKFQNNLIQELSVKQCNISNFKLIELNNLEILTLKSQKMMYAYELISSITKFKYLQELNIYGYNIIDLNPLLQMEFLTRLSLSSCGLKDIENLRLLTNLKSLDISKNQYIDFNSLSYFTRLSVLNLRSCGLNTIDFLKNLVNLEKLNIQNNSIMHIQLVEDLNKLLILNAQNNRIIDEYKIVYHPHFKWFNFSDQEQPSEEIQRQINKQRGSYVYKWEQKNSEKYQGLIKNESLTIENDPELLCLHFMRNFNIKKLVLNNCVNVAPILHNQNITELQIKKCDIQSIKQLDLENLEVLQLDQSKLSSNCSSEIIFSNMFKNLKQLSVHHYKCDFSLFSQKRQLKILSLKFCKVKRTDQFVNLISLQELQLLGNKNIDITPLQNLTQLIILDLQKCCINNIDIMNRLVNLEQLDLNLNNIVYIYPLRSLNKLQKLDVQFNNIIDIQTIINHRNFKMFYTDQQSAPVQKDLMFANKLRDIHAPINNLRYIRAQRMKISEYRYQIADMLQAIKYSQITLYHHVTTLFRQINQEIYQ